MNVLSEYCRNLAEDFFKADQIEGRGRACQCWEIAYKELIRKLEGKRSFEWRFDDWPNVRMDFKEMECEGVDWISLYQDKGHWRAVVNTAMDIRVPVEAWCFFTNWPTVSFSKRNVFHWGGFNNAVRSYAVRVFSIFPPSLILGL